MEMLPLEASWSDTLATQAALAFIHPWSAAQFQDSFRSGHWVIGAMVGEVLQGHAVFSRLLDEAELLTIAVAPVYQGRGVAQVLLTQALAQLAATGIVRVMLEVRASNQAAIHLYEKLGFVQEGRRKQYYPAETSHASTVSHTPQGTATSAREDAILMGLALSSL